MLVEERQASSFVEGVLMLAVEVSRHQLSPKQIKQAYLRVGLAWLHEGPKSAAGTLRESNL